jgi:hypothetical protein
VQEPGSAEATSAEFFNLHVPLTILNARVPFDGLWSNSLNGFIVFGERVEVVSQAPDSGTVVAEKIVFTIELLTPFAMVIE